MNFSSEVTQAPSLTVLENKPLTDQKSSHATLDEAIQTLSSLKFVETETVLFTDRWSSVNCFRSMVSLSLNQGLSEIVSRYGKGNLPIIEIGSGVGYTFSEPVSKKMIRTQPSLQDCTLLSQTTKDPIYQVGIEGIHRSFLMTCQKISLFVAINVFDTLSSKERRMGFGQLSHIQGEGDHLLLLNDTNPCIDTVFEQLTSLYPQHAIFPYMPLSNNPTKISAVLVPMQYLDGPPPTESDFINHLENEARANTKGLMSRLRIQLFKLQQTLNLKIICLEDFYIQQVKEELKECGYETTTFYHTSFVTGELSKKLSPITQDLIYKSVTDTMTVRQWKLSDPRLLDVLSQKGLTIPAIFDHGFLANLKEKGHKIFGAEIHVIAAKKVNA